MTEPDLASLNHAELLHTAYHLREQRDRARYERTLLHQARILLDTITTDHDIPDHVRDRAAEIAQRITDETGDPATGEPPYGPHLRYAVAEITRIAAPATASPADPGRDHARLTAIHRICQITPR